MLRPHHILRDCRLLWTDGRIGYVARGTQFWEVELHTGRAGRRYCVGGLGQWLAARLRVPRQLGRFGIHHLWPLADGAKLVVARKRVLRVDATGAHPVLVLPRGNKPAHKGVCVTPNGAVFLAEYAMNLDRKLPVALYRSTDDARTFSTRYEFAPGTIRHIHFVQWDPVTQSLWLGTGDADHECWIYTSRDGGATWFTLGGGSQLWRAVSVAFRHDAVYWGTDAGSDAGKHPNYVMRYDRASGQLSKALEIQGPCHGNAVLADGTVVVTTGVEGGENEKDRRSHLWMSADGCQWREEISYRKDLVPLIVQFGVIRLPAGLERSSILAYTCLGLAGAGEKTFIMDCKSQEVS